MKIPRPPRDRTSEQTLLTDRDSLTEATAAAELDRIVSQLRLDPPIQFDGCGIVICAGGAAYFLCAWVCINMLRRLGCQLPIELWHLDDTEINSAMRRVVAPFGVRCVNASAIRYRYPVRRLHGWELKSFAILHSRFQKVLLLDADNIPVVDPTFLFATPQFRDTGAIFWPDITRLPLSAKIWQLTNIPPRLEPEFESGQIVLDKNRCYRALALTMWFNEHSDFWYKYIYGDKDTFHMAWHKLEQRYSMPSRAVYAIPATMCQHDFDGRRIFQHRNKAKWLIRRNRCLRGFEWEPQCVEFIEQLAANWHEIAGVDIYEPSRKTEAERQIAKMLTGSQWLYRRIDHEERTINFCADGTVGDGAAALETFWDVTDTDGFVLDISSQNQRTCRLLLGSDGTWRGRWEVHERMSIELVPVAPPATAPAQAHVLETRKFIRDFLGERHRGYFVHIGATADTMMDIANALFQHGWSGVFIAPTSEGASCLRERYAASSGVEILEPKITGENKKPNGDGGNIGQIDLVSPGGPSSIKSEVLTETSSVESNGDRLSLSEALASRIKNRPRTVLFFDHPAGSVMLIPALVKAGVRPRLIFWQTDAFYDWVRRAEMWLVELGYVQVFKDSALCGWSALPAETLDLGRIVSGNEVLPGRYGRLSDELRDLRQ